MHLVRGRSSAVGVRFEPTVTSLPGLRRERMGDLPRTSGMRAWLSWRLAAEIPIDRRRPLRSTMRWISIRYCRGRSDSVPSAAPYEGSP
jgi:hypothetical protein